MARMHAALLALTLALSAGQSRTPVLVELFTSESCDNCPKQEEALSRLAQTQPVERVEVIPLSFHMDAYDHLGWKDRFGSLESTRRQRRYNAALSHGNLFPPHMVVDGERSFLASEEEARRHVEGAGKRRKQPLKLTVRTEKDALVLRVDLEQKPAKDVEVWAALAEDGLSTKVTAGPNKGRTLAHPAVVRTWLVLPEPRPEGPGFRTETRLTLAPGWKRERLRVVVAVQKPWGGRVEALATAAPGSKP
jgi:hypothetical protein